MAGSLEFVKSATGTSVSSLSVTDCFSDKYDVYKIVIDTYEAATAQELAIRLLDSGGSVISASEYDRATLFLRAYNTFQEGRATSADKIEALGFNSATTVGIGLVMYIFNPFDSSSFTFFKNQTSSFVNGSGGIGYKAIAVHKSAEQTTGINLFGASGHNLDDIKVVIYGVK